MIKAMTATACILVMALFDLIFVAMSPHRSSFAMILRRCLLQVQKEKSGIQFHVYSNIFDARDPVI